MTTKSSLIVILAGVVLLGGFMAPTSRSEPERLEPRRHSPFPPAYLTYTFKLTDYIGQEAIGADRMYYLMPDKPGRRGMMLLSYRELLDHYRVGTAQLNRAPTRMPTRWIASFRGE